MNSVVRGLISLSIVGFLAGGAVAEWEESADYPYPVPTGLKKPPVPTDNPLSDAKVALGKALYFDTRLSADKTVSCATCHNPKKGWTDQAPVSTGIRGQKGARSAPSVLNSAYYDKQFWDGRAPSLEEQAKGPIQNPIEMGNTHEAAVATLRGIPGYGPLFEQAFGSSEITIDRVAQAIASFERTVLTGNSPYDLYEAGDKKALSASAQRGLKLFFGKANCSVCHTGFNFSNSDFHNIGVGMTAKDPDLGREKETKDMAHRGAFKTPTLRNLAHTAPYMHDGSEKTLESVVEYYNKGGFPNPWRDKEMKPLGLTKAEKKDLVNFLKSLNGDKVEIKAPPLP
ncbi:MAG: cytochrome-c peroxidase [Elusimicrobia bacterium]|nr:cytochrome-c peroxidase [Elusimicrobiota bacterium]